VEEGSGAVFSVSGSGTSLSYKWYLNGVALSDGVQADGSVVSGSSRPTVTVTGTTGAESDGTYTVVLTNSLGSVTSSPAVLSLVPPGSASSTFAGVGDLPGGAFNSQVRAATDDGQIAVGSGSVLSNESAIDNASDGGDRPFLWTSTAGISELAGPVIVTSGTLFETGSDITPDGAVIAGRVRTNSTAAVRESALWRNDGKTLTLIPDIAGYDAHRGAANSISSDGTVAYGWSVTQGGIWQAYRWTAGTGTVGLGFLNGSDIESIPAARGCSSDGSVVVGMDLESDGVTSAAFYYKVGVGMSALGTLGGGTWSSALAVTPDGSTVFGSGSSTRFPLGEYFTWTQGGGMNPIGVGNPYDISNNLGAISADGQVVAGSTYIHNANGFMAVDQTLAAAGLNITGWSQLFLLGMNHNERVLYGQGVDPSGNPEGWVATVAPGFLQGLALPAAITYGPPNQTAMAGMAADFGAGTSGGPGLTAQWFENGTALADGLQSDGSTVSGSASPYLQMTNVPISKNGNGYTIHVQDGNGNHATSAAGVLTVIPVPMMTVLLPVNTALGGPLNLANDGAYLYVAGTNLGGSSDPNTSATGLSMFRLPLSGGTAASLCPVLNPMQIAVLGGNVDWIDPTAATGMTQILQAPAAGGGPVTAIYSYSVNPAITSGTGLGTDGTYLYALDSSDGQLYRLNADGSGLTALGGPRYATGPQTESLAVYGGKVYVLESGESSLATDLVSIPTDASGPYSTVWDGTIGPFFDPQCVAVGDGMIYVSDLNPATFLVTTIWAMPVSGGNPVALVTGAPFSNISGLTFADGVLYVSDSGNGIIYQIQVNP
jgi:probable HAF family extracellular repeat protein